MSAKKIIGLTDFDERLIMFTKMIKFYTSHD